MFKVLYGYFAYLFSEDIGVFLVYERPDVKMEVETSSQIEL